MNDYDVIVVGSGGGGGALAWIMAKAGKRVLLIEQGPSDLQVMQASLAPLAQPAQAPFDARVHSEYDFRVRAPDIKRRAAGDYNTFRRTDSHRALPTRAGWTASMLGGGSGIWGAWSLRALPVDLVLEDVFREAKIVLSVEEGYSVPNWPIKYADLAAYFPMAELLFGVSGDRHTFNENLKSASWMTQFGPGKFGSTSDWFPTMPFPNPAMPRTPIGAFLADSFALQNLGKVPAFDLPMAIVSPALTAYQPDQFYQQQNLTWPENIPILQDIFKKIASRSACRQCGYCGEFLCFGGASSPKAGTQVTAIAEMQTMNNVSIRTSLRVTKLISKAAKVTHLHCLNISDPLTPITEVITVNSTARVVISGGAVQSARLLLLSGFGTALPALGRYVTFHLFGLSAKAVLKKELRGQLRAEFGPTGNTGSFEPYFTKVNGQWRKAGIITSTAKKNPLENAIEKIESGLIGEALLKNIDDYNRTVEIRCTADDLPSWNNMVDLDPDYVDQYGIPVARITRNFGSNERWLFAAMRPELETMLRNHPNARAIDLSSIKTSDAIVDLIGDHQMGTCRMGNDPKTSVVNEWCRVHNMENLFVVDSSFMPTGLGLNPMMTVVANAMRVATAMVAGKC